MIIRINKKALLAVILVIAASACFFGTKTVLVMTDTQKTELPIIMYHHIQEKGKLLGRYCITPKQLKDDFEYIKANGYTPITSQELLDFADNGIPLPEKPIMITFDDGYLSNYVYAFELLKEYNFKAVISIIGLQADRYSELADSNVSYAHATWEQLLEMQESGLVEIANHTYNMHSQYPRKGCKKMNGENLSQYETCITTDIMTLENKMYEFLGKRSQIFTYPFGAVSDCCPAIIQKMGFRITLGCEEGMNYISDKDTVFYSLKRYNRAYRLETEKFFSAVSSGKKIKA